MAYESGDEAIRDGLELLTEENWHESRAAIERALARLKRLEDSEEDRRQNALEASFRD